MRKCTGNNTQEWGFDSIFDVQCQNCGHMVEFFKDEITRNCPKCRAQMFPNWNFGYVCPRCGYKQHKKKYGVPPLPKFRVGNDLGNMRRL